MGVRRFVVLAGIAGGLAALVGCGSSGEANPAPTSPATSAAATPSPTAAAVAKACDLVTPAEAATALGLSAPPAAKDNTELECSYLAPDGIDEVSLTLETEEYLPGTEDLVIELLGQDKAVRIEGLGDAAFSFNAGVQGQVHVWAKGRYVLVAVTRKSGGDPMGPVRTLAEKAVSRL